MDRKHIGIAGCIAILVSAAGHAQAAPSVALGGSDSSGHAAATNASGFLVGKTPDDRNDLISRIARDVATSILLDRGDLSLALDELEHLILASVGRDTKCTRKRVTDLKRAWMNFIKASHTGDVANIVLMSERLRYEAEGRSSMYNRCYKHMRKKVGVLAEVADSAFRIVAIAATG